MEGFCDSPSGSGNSGRCMPEMPETQASDKAMEPERIKVMRFAENNRISHRQLFRQIILVFPAPFLLCLFKNGAMLGISAMAGTAAAAVVLSFYVIWLIRLTPSFEDSGKVCRCFCGKV